MTRPFMPDRPVDEAASLESLANGGLPTRAQRRIWEHNNSPNKIFTSTLNISETVVARATGLSAISQVMGSSVFHVGYRGYATWGGGELEPLTRAHHEARTLALSRMQEEGRLLGAHVVLDVKFEGRGYAWATDLIEIIAVGTAMRIDGVPPPERPVLAILESDQLYKLHKRGYWPAGIAIGNCCYYTRHADCVSEGNWYGQVLSAHQDASQQARDLAVGRFRDFAHHLKADGVVGTRVHRHGHDTEWEVNKQTHTSFFMDLMIVGTAIRRVGPPLEDRPKPRVVVDLRDK